MVEIHTKRQDDRIPSVLQGLISLQKFIISVRQFASAPNTGRCMSTCHIWDLWTLSTAESSRTRTPFIWIFVSLLRFSLLGVYLSHTHTHAPTHEYLPQFCLWGRRTDRNLFWCDPSKRRSGCDRGIPWCFLCSPAVRRTDARSGAGSEPLEIFYSTAWWAHPGVLKHKSGRLEKSQCFTQVQNKASVCQMFVCMWWPFQKHLHFFLLKRDGMSQRGWKSCQTHPTCKWQMRLRNVKRPPAVRGQSLCGFY